MAQRRLRSGVIDALAAGPPAIISIRSSTTAGPGSGTSDVTVTLPTHATDDLMIIYSHAEDNVATDIALGTATGWTQMFYEETTVGQDAAHALHYKVATSASETNPVMDLVSGASGDEFACICYVLDGINTATPIDVAHTAAHRAVVESSATPDQPDITTVTDQAAVFLFCNNYSAAAPVLTAPSGYILGETSDGGSYSMGHAAYDLDVGDLGVQTIGSWAGGASSDETMLVTIAIRPE